jgi:chromate transporter
MKIGLFTFGGGYAMIALLESEFVSKKKWLSREEFLDMVAISESTPGPIAINAATYIGYKTRGLLGALLATVGVIIPSFIIIYAISLFFDAFLSIALVAKAFRGIQVAVVYLILSAGIKLLRGMKKTVLSVFILSATVLFMLLFSVFAIRFSTVLYILIAGAIGVSLYLIQVLRKREGAAK